MAHPGPLVQSSAMASVLPPAPTYTKNLPEATIRDGLLSLPQIEAVVYAGKEHHGAVFMHISPEVNDYFRILQRTRGGMAMLHFHLAPSLPWLPFDSSLSVAAVASATFGTGETVAQ